MRVIWDEPKRLSNIETHGLDFVDAAERFAFEGALLSPSYPDRSGRLRYVAIGVLDGDLVNHAAR